MKTKIILIFMIVFSLLQAQEQGLKEKIEQTILDKTNTRSKVIQVKPLNIKNLYIASIEVGGNQIPLFVSDDGETIFGVPEIFFSANNKILEETRQAVADTQNHNTRGKQQRIVDMFKDKKSLTVNLLSTGKKTNKVTYIVSDPNCPYCKDEMQRIDEVLSNSNVLLIFVGIIGGTNSMSKSSYIIETAQRLSQQKKSFYLILRRFISIRTIN